MCLALPARGESAPLPQPGRPAPAQTAAAAPAEDIDARRDRTPGRLLAFDLAAVNLHAEPERPGASAEGPPEPRWLAPGDFHPRGLPVDVVRQGRDGVRNSGERRAGRLRLPRALDAPLREVRGRLRTATSGVDRIAPSLRRVVGHGDRQYRDLVEHASDMVFTLDRGGRIVSVNAAGPRLTGFSREELRGRCLCELAAAEDAARVCTALRCITAAEPFAVFDASIATRHRGRLTLEVHAWLLRRPGRAAAIQGIARDVTERRFREAQYRHAALYDALTGLPNRLLLYDRLQQSLAAATRGQQQLALLLLDLDRFKAVNDAHGHLAGDQLLQQVGWRLGCALRGSDTVARLGGDEFAVLLPATSYAGAAVAGARLLRAFDTPFVIDGRLVAIGASAGVAVFPLHGVVADALLRCADRAMYRAKRAGGGLVIYQAAAATAATAGA